MGGVADGINSVVNPFILLPPNWGVSVLEETQGFTGGVNFSLTSLIPSIFFFGTLICPGASKLSSVSLTAMVDNKARSDEITDGAIRTRGVRSVNENRKVSSYYLERLHTRVSKIGT